MVHQLVIFEKNTLKITLDCTLTAVYSFKIANDGLPTMFTQLDYDKYKSMKVKYGKISVYKEIPADIHTPIQVYTAIKNIYKNPTILESGLNKHSNGRYSHICFSQIFELKAFNKNIVINYNNKDIVINENPFSILEQYRKKLQAKTSHPQPGYIGGLVGYIGYDSIRLIENIGINKNTEDNKMPDILLRSYKHNITFDHKKNTIIISTLSDETFNESKKSYLNSFNKINEIMDLITKNKSFIRNKLHNTKTKNLNVNVNIDDTEFSQTILKAKENIQNGDIFQTVLSRTFSIPITCNDFDIYRALRYSNPSPYMFFIVDEHYSIAGASPEKLISIKNNIIESKPLAGTKKRNNNDQLIANELLNDSKEVAEHMMLVDLARNDIGSISKPGSVKVTKLKSIEKFKKLLHISSTVQGILKDEVSVFDAIKSTFPAGTLTGAPKIESMKIINTLERSKRGIYGGIVCGIDSNNNLESCIAIRTALIKDKTAHIQTGAGIVHDSKTNCECIETYNKAKAIIDGVMIAEERRI